MFQMFQKALEIWIQGSVLGGEPRPGPGRARRPEKVNIFSQHYLVEMTLEYLHPPCRLS